MEFSYFKFINYCNKNGKVSKSELCRFFNLSNQEITIIMNNLAENGYVKLLGYDHFIPTYLGKHFFQDWFMHWLGVNLIAILALIISIVAVIVSIIALVLK